jgi:hypothetical protein
MDYVLMYFKVSLPADSIVSVSSELVSIDLAPHMLKFPAL